MEAEVHLVGDVPEVAAAARGAAVVHLEARDDARSRRPGSPSCPGRRCRGPSACRGTCGGRRARGRGSRSGSAPSGTGGWRARSRCRRSRRTRGPSRRPRAGPSGSGRASGEKSKPVSVSALSMALPAPSSKETTTSSVLRLEDRLVEGRQEGLERHLPGRRHAGRKPVVLARRGVAEEVRPAGRVRARRGPRRPGPSSPRISLDRGPDGGAAEVALDVGLLGVHPRAERAEVRAVQREPERALERVEELRRARRRAVRCPGARAAHSVNRTSVEGLAPRDRAGDLVVAAAVRDPAAEDPALLVEHDRLRRRRAEVDADEALHASLPSLRAAGRASGGRTRSGS